MFTKHDLFHARLFSLLHRPRRAKYQDARGDYGGATRVNLGDFEDHLRGITTFSLASVEEGRANFLAWDIDVRFEERLQAFRHILLQRGLATSAFAVTGSSRGRGKVVLVLKDRLPQQQAVRLAKELLGEAARHAAFGPFSSADVSVYPTEGDGSFVRLLGRNRRRVWHQGVTETPLDLQGDLSDLLDLAPANIPAEDDAPVYSHNGLPRWVEAILSQAFTGTTKELFSLQVRLAGVARGLYQNDAATYLTAWFTQLDGNSTNLSASSRQNLQRADVVATVLRYANERKGTTGSLWRPLALENGHHSIPRLVWCPKSKMTASARRVYQALTAYVLGHGLDPHCVGFTFDRIAAIAGFADKGASYKAVQKAQDSRLVFRLDTGTNVRDGLCGLYAFVGQGEDLQAAYDAGVATEMYRERLQERTRLGLPPPEWVVEDGLPARRSALAEAA